MGKANTTTGLTVIEILLIIGIIGVIAAVALPNFRDMKQLNDLDTAESIVLHTLEQARSRAVSGVGTADHGVRIEAQELTSFEVETGDERHIPLPTSTTTDHEETEIVFERLTGQVVDSPDDGITVVITNDKGSNETIHIQPNGTIYVQE